MQENVAYTMTSAPCERPREYGENLTRALTSRTGPVRVVEGESDTWSQPQLHPAVACPWTAPGELGRSSLPSQSPCLKNGAMTHWQGGAASWGGPDSVWTRANLVLRNMTCVDAVWPERGGGTSDRLGGTS